MNGKRITHIRKASDGRYLIFVDGENLLSVHEDVLVKFRLYKDMEIEPDLLREMAEEEEIQRVKQAALRYLSHRPRTEAELRNRLLSKGFEAGVCDRVVEEMKELGYINDHWFVRAWIRERQDGKKLGAKRLRQELIRKGIAPSLVDEALMEIPDDRQRQMAMELAERRCLRLVGEPWRNIERKVGAYLLRRGFGMEDVMSVLKELRLRHEQEEGKR
ncbi:RecX family transcriptional regulator [Staphylospora marina]|uniref:RecX family transcriptional regulator n=1 Tax=Staphylospora marina TaxID=2490858 RepID=UPI000F5BCF91|nr:RecX family transcriptional regulator [Staphylospora marina]